MTLFRRASDILTANLNEWIERWEDPERMLKQLVRELEQACEVAMEATAKAIANERLLERQREAHRIRVELLQERARDAVVRGDEAAARNALATRLRQETRLSACEVQQQAAARESSRLRRQLDVLRSRLTEAKQTMHVYIARQQLAESRQTLARLTAGLIVGNEVWGGFDRMRERVDRADAETTALLELLEEADLDDETSVDRYVEHELESLKATVASG